jgi:hypothetical protein
VQPIRGLKQSTKILTIGFGSPLLLALLCLSWWFLSDLVNRILVDITKHMAVVDVECDRACVARSG